MIPFMLNRNNEAPAVLIITKAKYTIRHSSNFVYSNLNPFVTHIFIKVKKTVIKASPPKVSEELNKDIRSRAQIDINMNLSKNCKIKLLPVNGANTFWIRLRSVLIIINKNYFSVFSIYISDTVPFNLYSGPSNVTGSPAFNLLPPTTAPSFVILASSEIITTISYKLG